MTLPSPLWAHVHVSERESAHHWPDGQFDDAADEDCTMDTAVEMARLAHDANIPSTHYEAERLRQAAGEDPLGGTSQTDALRGLEKRYGFKPKLVSEWPNIAPLLVPGTVVSAQGKMSAFAYTDGLRRHQPSFNGAHCVLWAQVDTLKRVWWCDPLGALGSYQGEWVTHNDAAKYVNALDKPNGFLVAKIKPKIITTPNKGRVVVTAGSWWDYTITGTILKGYTADRVSRQTNGFSSTVSIVRIFTWGGRKRTFLYITTGIYASRWLDANDTHVTYTPA